MRLTESNVDRMGSAILARGIFQACEGGDAPLRAYRDRCDHWHHPENGGFIGEVEAQEINNEITREGW